ncbi:hypothetical protein V494_02083 [Pseudogymnoascus sp. VKM F-4513 (FW-928)]|nr:hypothetical protein V494_02083 [Pseudogymnoascus sp. VKM F-4513 (FW-928)]
MDIATQCSAANAVLSIPELLEAILLDVDMKTLLLSQRVNRNWASIITASSVLQQALFFQPAQEVSSIIPFDPTDNHFGDHDSEIIYNPLLVAKFGPAFFKRDNAGIYTRLSHRANYFYKLPWSRRATAYARIDDWDEIPSEEEPDPEVVAEEKEIRRCFTRSGASWRRMLVSQPPPPMLGYFLLDLHSGWTQVSTAMVEPSCGGLRMGELYDIVQYHSGHHETNSMWFRVTRRGLGFQFMFEIQKSIHQGMMNKTNLVVEIQNIADYGMHAGEPKDVEAFDADFRCDDFRHVDVDTEIVYKEPF